VGSGHDQRTATNTVTLVAVDLHFLLWEVWDAAIVLLVAGVSVEDDGSNLVLDVAAEFTDGVRDYGGTLAAAC